jgi:hypothetical protein
MKRAAALGSLLVAMVGSRLCHSDILWADGDYHLAAAVQMMQGSVLYRDIWFDKPPLTPLLYVVLGARPGVWLMLGSAGILFLACVLAWWIGRKFWGEREGLLAALLLTWALIFYLPAAVIPLVPDLAMIVSHLAAIACLAGGFPAWAGTAAALAFLFNVKGLLVLAVCLLLRPHRWARILAGFCAVCGAAALVLLATGAWAGYVDQVWRWSLAYAGSPSAASPWLNGARRTANWIGFHSALAAGTLVFLLRSRGKLRRDAAAWIAVSALGVCLGLRFMPRYFFQLLPVLAVFGARGVTMARDAWPRITAVAVVLLLLIPASRFGPRYLMLASDLARGREHRWQDLALDQDNKAVASILRKSVSGTHDTLMVWGYRPGIYAYTGMRAGVRFMDSQPLTGVPADRHFLASDALTPSWARDNRLELARSSPTFVVDALSSVNPELGMGRYPELREWLGRYRIMGQTPFCIVYRLKSR